MERNVNYEKYLELMIDEQLTWEMHIQNLASKIITLIRIPKPNVTNAIYDGAKTLYD